MKRSAFVAICCGLLVAAAGCRTNPGIKFDRRGWGGPGLVYTLGGKDNTITIKRGMLMNENFRWAESEFSFEFLDQRDLVWGMRLLDDVFLAQRRRDIRSARTIILTGSKTSVPGSKLPNDQLWRLWVFDRVLDIAFTRREKGIGYKVLGGVCKQRILPGGLRAVEVKSGHDVRLKQNGWNSFSAKIVGGKFSYVLNGQPGRGTFQVDPRTNGRLGMFVGGGGPLVIRNLRLGAQPPRK